jgi:hypothetical protein
MTNNTASRRRRRTVWASASAAGLAAVICAGAHASGAAPRTSSTTAGTAVETATATARTGSPSGDARDAGPDPQDLPDPTPQVITTAKEAGDSPEMSVAAASGDMCGAAGRAGVYRTKVVARGKKWVTQEVPYSQSACHRTAGPWKDRYRTDCSGFVSMVWALDNSYTTADFVKDRAGKWSTVPWKSLKPGDAVVYRKNGRGHIILFVGWANSAHTAMKAYEEKGSAYGTVATVRYVSTLKANGYHPIRYAYIY